MPTIPVSVKNLSKKYQLKSKANGNASHEFWALHDVSFDVARGDILGVIGKNGSGKSTLLKIMSDITKPSSGEVRMSGSASFILEIGTGIHRGFYRV